MEQRCVQLFGNEWKKILQCHYTLCRVKLSPAEPSCSEVVLHFFFFWLDFESKMAEELSLESSVRVLKLDVAPTSLFLHPTCVY